MLSGGGARGAAHVGVLKVLDEMRVPVDAIAGTSMGAVVGGLYASGMSAAEIETLMRSVNWQDAFQRSPAARGARLPAQAGRSQFPGALRARRDATRASCCRAAWCRGRSSSRCCATPRCRWRRSRTSTACRFRFAPSRRIWKPAQAVVMDSGDLVTAMRASMSAPGVFAPAQRDGRLLVDGGLVENLPIDTARAMGVDVLIVVDVSFPLYSRDELTSPLEVTNQAFAILIRGRTLEQRAKLLPTDIVIDPPLGRFPSADFSRVPQALRAGEEAARGASTSLAKLSLERSGLSQLSRRRARRARPQLPVIEFVRADSALRRSTTR